MFLLMTTLTAYWLRDRRSALPVLTTLIKLLNPDNFTEQELHWNLVSQNANRYVKREFLFHGYMHSSKRSWSKIKQISLLQDLTEPFRCQALF